ncbi:helix-turn-helix domain-containing protein [Sporanaerobacter acetigenes]|uniref:Helix-turn-helix n=1 Tax=Sporanaerobacter acetigenes DSM 13106 TaxID=1123281 RepID=A0A1M5U5V8_9FIRM|nr:helix-turn-helix transcriptional regulator [Sporanaerobacter acetigenes]SHH58226.1 Helix-turn-helix [Sporanaerobacter acetigenes DSM 13106]
MDTLQEILINKRKDLGLSLRKAAKLIGISHSYLNNLEKGIDPNTKAPVNPTPETLSLISEAYKIDYNELMIAAGYITVGENTKVYDQDETKEGIEDMLNYYRSLQLSNLILELSPKNQERVIEYVKLLKLSEKQGLDLDE